MPEGTFGFIYEVTHSSGRKYLGKKVLQFNRTLPPLKGMKRKRKVVKESDWKTYWGSSDHLNADVLELGEDSFTREILEYCTTRGVMSYVEAELQFKHKVLLSDDYYNGIINCRIGGSKILKESLKDR